MMQLALVVAVASGFAPATFQLKPPPSTTLPAPPWRVHQPKIGPRPLAVNLARRAFRRAARRILIKVAVAAVVAVVAQLLTGSPAFARITNEYEGVMDMWRHGIDEEPPRAKQLYGTVVFFFVMAFIGYCIKDPSKRENEMLARASAEKQAAEEAYFASLRQNQTDTDDDNDKVTRFGNGGRIDPPKDPVVEDEPQADDDEAPAAQAGEEDTKPAAEK